jgi:hypothetical protein
VVAVDVGTFPAGATGVTRPGRITIEDSSIQVPGLPEMAGYGTLVVAKGLKSGTFKLLGRGASGPNGMPITGSWACGVRSARCSDPS